MGIQTFDGIEIRDDLETTISEFGLLAYSSVYGNLWNKDNTSYGFFSVGDGGKLITNTTSYLYSPSYIPISGGATIWFNTIRPTFVSYDKNLNIIECVQPPWSGYVVPQDARFIRMSVGVGGVNGLYVFVEGTSQVEYKSETSFCIPKLINKKPPVVVDYLGTGDYTSLTEALYETDRDVIVNSGTYDIVAEYKSLFGQNVFDLMTYQSSSVNGIETKGFQWGLYIDNRTVSFAAGSYIVCDLSGYQNDNTRRFSPFNLVENAIIDGLHCYAVNPYYIVHDDFGSNDVPFTNMIKNCIMVSPEPAQGNIIGGGCRKSSLKFVHNCYLDNGTNRQVTMRYHNVNQVGAAPRVVITNTRCNGKIRLNRYGSQDTTKMIAIVNNCKASAIEIADEVEGAADNVVLYQWCNEVN